MITIRALVPVWLLLCGVTPAQVTAHIGAGLIVPSGSLAGQRDLGPGVLAGAGFNVSRVLSLTADFNSNTLTLTPTSKQVLPFTSDTIWSFTANSCVRLGTGHGIQPYALVGYGIFSVHDPVTSRGVMKAGINLGGGINYRIAEDASLFFEARFNRVPVSNTTITFVPFIFGFRWR